MTGEITTRFSSKAAASVAVSKPVGNTTKPPSALEEPFIDLGSGIAFVVDWSKLTPNGMVRMTPTGDFNVVFVNTPKAGVVKKIQIALIGAAGKVLTLPTDGTWGADIPSAFSTGEDLISVLMKNGEPKSSWMHSFKDA